MPYADGDFSDLGGYAVDREVGRGGHATVHQAHQVSDPRRMVALKVLDEGHTPRRLATTA